IVRRIVVDQLGGELSLRTTPGAGTTFMLRVPLTISIIDALIFECGQQRFAVPIAAIEEIVEIDQARVVRTPRPRGGEVLMIVRRGEALPLVDLGALLKMAPG